MKYKWSEYTINGWGGEGVIIDRDYTIENPVTANEYVSNMLNRPMVTHDDIMVGTGEGWETEIIMNREWLEDAIRFFNVQDDRINHSQ